MALDSRDYLRLIQRHLWMLLLFVIAAGGAAFIFSKREPKLYTAQAKILIFREPLSQGMGSYSSFHVEELSYLLASETMLRIYASRTDFDLTSAETEAKPYSLMVKNLDGTDIFELSIQSSDPSLSCKISNLLVNAIVDCMESKDYEYDRQTLAKVRHIQAAATAKSRLVRTAVADYERLHGELKPPGGTEDAALAIAAQREAAEELHAQNIITESEYCSLLSTLTKAGVDNLAVSDERTKLLYDGWKADFTYGLLTEARAKLELQLYLATFQAYLVEPALTAKATRSNAPINAAAAMACSLVMGISVLLARGYFASSKQARSGQ